MPLTSCILSPQLQTVCIYRGYTHVTSIGLVFFTIYHDAQLDRGHAGKVSIRRVYQAIAYDVFVSFIFNFKLVSVILFRLRSRYGDFQLLHLCYCIFFSRLCSLIYPGIYLHCPVTGSGAKVNGKGGGYIPAFGDGEPVCRAKVANKVVATFNTGKVKGQSFITVGDADGIAFNTRCIDFDPVSGIFIVRTGIFSRYS